jgi:hypothetical protein
VRVLHVITGLHAGGAEQQLASLLEHTRHDADVVTMYAPGIIADRLVERGVAVHNLDRAHQLDLRALPELVRLMRRGAYDVVHTHLYRACLYGRVAARIAGIRTIVATEHSLGDTQIEGRPITGPARRIYLAGERCGHHTIAAWVAGNNVAYHGYNNVDATADHRLTSYPKAQQAFLEAFGG